MATETKYLRLDAAEVALVVTAFNHSRLSMWPAEQHPEVKSLVRVLGRFGVATAEELREDFEHKVRKPYTRRRKPVAPTLTLEDLTEWARTTPRGGK